MGKSCASCIRVLMILFGVIFMVVGLIVLAAGLYFYFSTFGLRGMVGHNILAYTYIVIAAIGSLSVLLGILGCCGSYHYSRCLLGFYFALLLVVFAAEIAISVAGFLYQDEARELLHATLKEGVADLKNADSDDVRWMDTVQFMFQCCGYDGQIDYGINPPRTCCPDRECSIKDRIIPYLPGCRGRIDDIMHNYFIVRIAIISIAFVEFIGLISALILCCAVSGRETASYYEPVPRALVR